MASASNDTSSVYCAQRVAGEAGRYRRTRKGLPRTATVLCAACLVTAGAMDYTQARPRSDAEQGKSAGKINSDARPRDPLAIIISITKQRLSLYAGKNLVARTSVSTGTRDHPTPLGVFTIVQKQRWHRSNLYSAAPMPYMQRITWSGIALHAGVLPGYPASHGCIRLSYEFATRLWRLTKTGVRVIIAREDLAPVDIVNPRLFVAATKIEVPSGEAEDHRPSPVQVIRTTATAELKASPHVEVPGKTPVSLNAPVVSAPHRAVPISILISRKLGMLFVRQASTALFESAVAIHDSQQPLGTHVFTAGERASPGGAISWTVVSIPERMERHAEPRRTAGHNGRADAPSADTPAYRWPSAAAALDRIDIPQETLGRLSELLVPGSSLIISDHGISDETDSDTDFIVLTR